MPSAVVLISSNAFSGVPFPLVVGDRFFHIYDEGGRFRADVFRWDEDRQEAVYEVRASQPLVDEISTNPTGIVTFTDSGGGGFLYKFRPKPGVSQIFGKVPSLGEVTVHCSDGVLRVMRGNDIICDAVGNTFVGCSIGIMVGVDGSLGFGVSRLPTGMTLTQHPAE